MNTYGQGPQEGTQLGVRLGGFRAKHLVLAGAILSCCGFAEGVALAQTDQPSRPSRQLNDMSRRSQATDARDPDGTTPAGRRAARRNMVQDSEAARNGSSVNAAQNGNTPNGRTTVGSLVDADGFISIDFKGPVELTAFLDYVSRAMGLTIRSVTIPSATVTFYAPVRIPVEQLLPLTRSILEDNNLTLVFDDASNTHVVRQLGQLPVGSETTRVFPTPLRSPSAVQTTIVQQLAGGSGVAGARFTPLDDLGVLIVTASPRTLDTVQTLLDLLNTQIDAQSLHAFVIGEVAATYARDRILRLVGEGVFSESGSVPRPGNQGGGAVAGGVSGTFSNIQSRLFVESGNRLMLRGTPEEAEMLEELIAIVDTVSTLRVKRYLVGATAAQVASSGSELGLGAVKPISAGATGGGGGFGGNRRSGSGQESDPEGEATASQFVLDTETGSFIYYGTEKQHERVEALVDEFKKSDLGDTIEIKTYKLLYASVDGGADERDEGVASILEQLITDPGQRATNQSPFLNSVRGGDGALDGIDPAILSQIEADQGDGGGDGQGGAGDGTRLIATTQNTTIVSDPSRNQIIIKAPRKAHEQFDRIIKQLDVRQSQVYLDVQIVSLISNDTFDFAADVQINSGQFSFLSSFGLTSTPNGGDPFTPRQVGLGNPGATSAIIRSDFLPLAINALETVGETRTLSNPRILINDNQASTYVSTSEQPFGSTTQGTATTVTSQGGVAEAGTTIEVTPRISAGGYITLEELSVELSSFTGLASDNLQPPAQRDIYTAEAVTLPSDSTIVVGGFQLDTDSDDTRKVPILGSIPLLGLLFSDIGESRNTTTVYIFITPRIMNHPRATDLKLLAEGPMREMGIKGDAPELEFVSVPVRGRLPVTRVLPRNDASDAVLWSERGSE